MKAIQIRDVPDEVHRSLRAKAAAAGLSLSAYLLREATKIAQRPNVDELLADAVDREWGVPPGRAAGVVRELRDERS